MDGRKLTPDDDRVIVFSEADRAAIAQALRKNPLPNEIVFSRDEIARLQPRKFNWNDGESASDYCRNLQASIQEFAAGTDPDFEMGLQLVTDGQQHVVYVRELRALDPSLIQIDGFRSNGDEVRLLKHRTQVDITLVRLPRLVAEPPRRSIGFHTAFPAQTSE